MRTSPMSPAAFQNIQHFAHPSINERTLEDIGLDADGRPLNEADPRFRRLPKRGTLEQLLRLVAVLSSHVMAAARP
jgi:hypothetical protein